MRNRKELVQVAVYLFAVCMIVIFALPIKVRALDYTEELRPGTYNVSALDSNTNYYVDQVQSVTINLDQDKNLSAIKLHSSSTLTIKSSDSHKLTMKYGIYQENPDYENMEGEIKVLDGVSLETGYLSCNKVDIDTKGTIVITGNNIPDDGGITKALHGYRYVKIKNATISVNSTKSTAITSRYLIEISNANVTAKGNLDGIYAANYLKISGKNTVIKASGSDEAIGYGTGKLTLSDPLKVVSPSGAVIGKQRILEADGATGAKNVEIKAAAYDGSAPGSPIAKGTELKDKTGTGTGYEVTSSDPANPIVAYKGTDADKKRTSIKIPDTVTDASGNIYKVTEIKNKAFEGNEKVKTIKAGNNVEKIGTRAFSKCKNLQKVTIGKNVTTIGAKAFNENQKLKKLTIKSKKLKKVGKNALKGTAASVVYKVPKGKVAKYTKLLNKGGRKNGSKVTD